MNQDPYRIDPSGSPLEPNSGYRMSGLFMAGLAGAILIILGVVWAAQHVTNEPPWTTASSAPTATTGTAAPTATTGAAR